MARATRFTDPAAVDAWDKWFRWRDPACLYDRTIDATWRRVANAIVPSDGTDTTASANRYVEAFSRWQLLPDEVLLCLAGTGSRLSFLDRPHACLNVAAFVLDPNSPRSRFDKECFARTAALAVRMLDDAMTVAHGALSEPAVFRIGLLGFADALDLLGIPYSDPRAIEQANTIGTALAFGTFQGSQELSEERGALGRATPGLLATWRDRCIPEPRIEAAARHGIRHRQLTAIDSQSRLSLFANNASDALDAKTSVPQNDRARTSAVGGGDRETTGAAQSAIRKAIQPWIDAPVGF